MFCFPYGIHIWCGIHLDRVGSLLFLEQHASLELCQVFITNVLSFVVVGHDFMQDGIVMAAAAANFVVFLLGHEDSMVASTTATAAISIHGMKGGGIQCR